MPFLAVSGAHRNRARPVAFDLSGAVRSATLGVARMDHIASGEAGTAEGLAPAGPNPALLAGLAHAMHAALVRERERIDEMVADEAKDHVEKARVRAAMEAAELRRLADDEVREIEAWAAREIMRIRREAARRSRERRTDMALFLQRHAAIIDTEIAGLETAVADYSATLAHFVASLIETGDPSEIARRADSLPTPPDLDEARALARARAVAAYDWIDDGPPAAEADAAARTAPADEAAQIAPADQPAASPEPREAPAEPGIAVMDPEANGRMAEPALPVDPLQVPEDEPVGAAERVTHDEDEEATEANGQPSGAFRFFRALVTWPAAPSAPHVKDAEARRS